MSELAHSASPLLPPLAVATYIACVAGAGALVNCSILAALFKTSRSGLLNIILQLAVADFLLGASICPELWSFNTRSWLFGNQSCIAYRGVNVFASTVSSYLVATIALHSLATVNFEEKATTKEMKRNLHDDDDEISSRHSLVTSCDSSTPRTMNLDYRLTSKTISVIQPTIFIWVLSLSLSVPEFVLATTVHYDHDIMLCTLVDTSQRLHMYSILALFNLFLPIIVMTAAGVLVSLKLRIKNILTQIDCMESIAVLKLSLWLIVSYMLLCAPRSVVTAFNVYLKTIPANQTSLDINDEIVSVNLATSSTYMFSTLLRPLLSIILLPRVRKMFSFGSYVQPDNV